MQDSRACERCGYTYTIELQGTDWIGACDCDASWDGPRWRYLNRTNIGAAELARLGELGWELVAVTRTDSPMLDDYDTYQYSRPFTTYYFRRPTPP